jgi:hypothetical protein
MHLDHLLPQVTEYLGLSLAIRLLVLPLAGRSLLLTMLTENGIRALYQDTFGLATCTFFTGLLGGHCRDRLAESDGRLAAEWLVSQAQWQGVNLTRCV